MNTKLNYKKDHELHFVVTSTMKKKIANIAKKENISLSKLICYVLQKFSERIKKRYCFEKKFSFFLKKIKERDRHTIFL